MDHILSKFLSKHFGSYKEAVLVPEALNHFVYKIVDQHGITYYVKRRGNARSGAPRISLNPRDIIFEKDATEILSALCPDIFPYITAEDIDNGLIAMTEVASSGESLLMRFKRHKVDERLVAKIGETVGFIHSKTSRITTAIREKRERNFFEQLIISRLMANDNNSGEKTIKELLLEPKQLIVGALTTKNILVKDHQVNICDLETVCQGSILFDIGFCMGHILIHTLYRKGQTERFLRSFQAGYEQILSVDYSTDLLKKIVLSTVLYRINNVAAPYEFELAETLKIKALERAKVLLAKDGLSWREVANLV